MEYDIRITIGTVWLSYLAYTLNRYVVFGWIWDMWMNRVSFIHLLIFLPLMIILQYAYMVSYITIGMWTKILVTERQLLIHVLFFKTRL